MPLQAEQDAGDEGRGEGEGDNPPVDADILRPRNSDRQLSQQRLRQRRRQQQAGDAAQQRQQHAFEDQLSQQSPRARAHRSADGKFATPAFGARQQQVGDVGAGDQQHQADGTEQQIKRRTDVADDVVKQRADLGGPAAIGLWIALG